MKISLLRTAALGFLALSALPGVAADSAKATKPNIIVIFTDDHGYADLGVQGQVSDIRTPHIDALANQGARMSAGYVTSPQCSPSRAGLITGRYQQRFGIDTIPDVPLPLEEVTIAERLKKAGYVSGIVGKWHLDPNRTSVRWARQHLPSAEKTKAGVNIPREMVRQYSALAQGFDDCFQGEMLDYFATYDLDAKSLDPRGAELKLSGFRLDIQTDAALAFLKRHHDKPFFLYLAYYGPHVPLEAPEKYLARFPGPMPERRRYALAMLSAIDDGVGRITAALRDYGVDDNTLIVFTADNGAPLKMTKADEKPLNLSSPGWDGSLNDPWVGEKGMLAEGGIRVPFVMRWPRGIPAGQTYAHAVSTLDIAATAVAVAGLPADARLDGVNLIPHLNSGGKSPAHEYLYWRFWNQAAVRNSRWKYLQAGNAANYLFDLSSDAHEKKNLIAEHPEVARELAAKLAGWTAQLQPPGNPNRKLNDQESSWYRFYFGLNNTSALPPSP
jgi:arylsulfatase A-like enzyme